MVACSSASLFLLFEIDVAIHDIGGSNASASSTATTISAVTVAEAIANYQSDPNIGLQVVVDSEANVTANLGGLDTLRPQMTFYQSH